MRVLDLIGGRVLCVCQESLMDCLCCIKMSVQRVVHLDKIPSVLHWIVERIYAPVLLNKYVRPIVVSSVVFQKTPLVCCSRKLCLC